MWHLSNSSQHFGNPTLVKSERRELAVIRNVRNAEMCGASHEGESKRERKDEWERLSVVALVGYCVQLRAKLCVTPSAGGSINHQRKQRQRWHSWHTCKTHIWAQGHWLCYTETWLKQDNTLSFLVVSFSFWTFSVNAIILTKTLTLCSNEYWFLPFPISSEYRKQADRTENYSVWVQSGSNETQNSSKQNEIESCVGYESVQTSRLHSLAQKQSCKFFIALIGL